MLTVHEEFCLSTKGHGHTLDLSQTLEQWLTAAGGRDGQVTVFVPGSTGAVTTIEFEDGALEDLNEALETLAPSDKTYHHDRRWGDGNGFSHLRAALLGPSVTIPVVDGRLMLGTWQQVVLVDCDNRPRQRRVVFSFVGAGRREG